MIPALGRKAESQTQEDLVQAAILATLEKRRIWNPTRIDLCRHLKMTIRSQCSALAKRKNVLEFVSESELVDDEGNSFYETLSAPPAAAEAEVMLQQIMRSVEDDLEARAVVKLLAEQKAASEIREELGLTKRHYLTVMRRVRRVVGPLTGQV